MLESAQNWNLRLSNITKVCNTLTIADQKKMYNFCYFAILTEHVKILKRHAVLVDFYITLTYSLTIGKSDIKESTRQTLCL